KIKNVKGVLSVLPITGALFITGFLAITGTPPFGIFLTKILIMSAGIKEHLFLSIAAVFLMAVLFVGFLKQVGAMMFGERPQEMDKSKESAWLIVSPLALIAIALCLSFYVPHFMSVLLTSAVSRY
ncbi:MAG: proton-conducting transporter membrane subunit, partial [Patescibacteria group bacterium]